MSVENKSVSNSVEAMVASLDDLKIGDMREVKVGEVTALLYRTKDGVFATGHKCTHYGAPLVKGVLCENRVVCPWHGACFNVKTGDIEDAPVLDALPSYAVRIDNNQVYVTVDQTEENTKSRRTPKMTKANLQQESRVFVIVGGGAAAMTAAETLRQEGFQGRVIMFSDESVLPYDRTKLSKAVNAPVQNILLRPQSFFDEHQIEIKLNHKVEHLDTSTKTVYLQDGSSQQYDELLIATGARPRSFGWAGQQLKNIFFIRQPHESAAIASLVDQDKINKVVLVGAGFIGLETAAWLVGQGYDDITAVDLLDVPFSRVFGDVIGNYLLNLHKSKGVKFVKQSVKAFEGKEQVERVILNDDSVLEADLVIIGVGAIPNTTFLTHDSQIKIDGDGGVTVNQFLQSSAGFYAAGDICRYPNFLSNEHVRIEHWDVAQQQGRVAARNMLGKGEAYRTVPYFWSAQYGGIRYCGHAGKFDNIVYQNKLQENKILAFFVTNNKISAVASVNMDPYVSCAAELFRLGLMPTVEQVEQGVDLMTLLPKSS